MTEETQKYIQRWGRGKRGLKMAEEQAAKIMGPHMADWEVHQEASKLREVAAELLAALQALMNPHGGTWGVSADHPAAIAAREAIKKATQP
jgi:hypothetical protein